MIDRLSVTSRSARHRVLAGCLSAAAFAVPATAQPTDDPYARCATLGADAERLACFDETYARSHELRAERETREAETRDEEFGFSQRDLEERRAAQEQEPARQTPSQATRASEPDSRAADQVDEADETKADAIVATIQAASDGARRALMVLDNGQVWREVDGSTMRNRVREGVKVTITRHWSGAYEMRLEARSGYLRVERVR